MDEKARKLVFVGYESGSKAYRLLDTTTDKDVHFIEGDHHDRQLSSIPVEKEKTDNVEQIVSDDEVKVYHFERQLEGGNKHSGDLYNQPQQHPVEVQQDRRSTRVNKGKPPENKTWTLTALQEWKTTIGSK